MRTRHRNRGTPSRESVGRAARMQAKKHGGGTCRVVTDNAFAYTNSHAFKAALATLGARHLTTRPYTPTNPN